MFSTQLIIDADHGGNGWEIVLRFGPEDMEAAWTDMTDGQLRENAATIGSTIVETVIADRERTV